MLYQVPSPVSRWVRNSICIVSCLSIPALIIAEFQGVILRDTLVYVVGAVSLWSMHYAFQRR